MRFLTVLDSTYKDRSTCERFRKSHYLNRGKNAMAMHSIENKHARSWLYMKFHLHSREISTVLLINLRLQLWWDFHVHTLFLELW